MRWNPFDLVSPAIDRTKKMLFPFRFWEWFKLMIISVLASSKGGSNFSGSNITTRRSEVPQDFLDQLRGFIKDYWILGALIFSVFFIFMTLLSYIKSVFTFIFIDSLVEKKARFTFSRNNAKGVSLFLFKFVITIITLLIIGGLACPYIFNFMLGNPVIASVGIPYIIFSICALIIYILILWIVFLFLYDFAVPYTYVKDTSVKFSLKKIWKDILNNKLEVFVYWLARLVLGIVMAIIAVIVAIVVLIGFIIIGALIFGIGFLLYKLIGVFTLFIILAIIIGIILVIIFLLTIGIILLPLSVFSRYFGLMNFEKLTKLKLFKGCKKEGKPKK